jgi:hypothetical protein
LFEQIPNPRSAHPDEHLDELGTRYGEEGDSGLTRDCAGQEGFACTRWADQQHAFGYACAQATKRFRIAKERNHLLKFVFRFVDAGYVAECHLGVGFDINFGARFPDRHQATKALALGHATDAVGPDQIKDKDRQRPRQYRREKVARRRASDFDTVRSQFAGKFWVDTGRAEQLTAIGERLLERALDGVRPDEHLGDLVLIEKLLELAVRNGLDLCVLYP